MVVNFFKAENFSKNRKQQLKGSTQFELTREKRLLIFFKMSLMHSSIRLDTTTRATTGTIPALGPGVGSCLRWSCAGLSVVGGEANRKWLLFKSVFVKYIISRAVD